MRPLLGSAYEDNRVVAVEGRVDLLCRDQGRHDQRLNVVVARAAEEADGHINERCVRIISFCYFLVVYFVFVFYFQFLVGFSFLVFNCS